MTRTVVRILIEQCFCERVNEKRNKIMPGFKNDIPLLKEVIVINIDFGERNVTRCWKGIEHDLINNLHKR